MKVNCSMWGILCMLLLNVHPLDAQLSFASVTRAYTASQSAAKITIQVKKEKLLTVLESIQRQSNYSFVYSNDEINVGQRISITVREKPIQDVMQLLMGPMQIGYEFVKDKIILKPLKPGDPLAEGGASEDQEQSVNSSAAASAEVTISGRVTDEIGNGLENVSVSLKGTSTGTVTNTNGYYKLALQEEQLRGTLIFSYIGYQPQEVSINRRLSVSVQLVSASVDLGEVVVIGYGTQSKSSVTGAVDKINKEAIEGRPVVTVSQALQGVSPNLIIQQRNFEPGQGVNINIRGLGTLGNNTPLVVVDGITGGDINLINPNDIENISVLKDAGTAAIYGSRSANGVILITTKKGKKNARPSVNYSGMYGIQESRVTYEPVHAWENAYFKNLSLVNSGAQPIYSPTQLREIQEKGDGDWRVENLLQNAPQQSHNITFSGGSSSSTYLLSVGYLNQRNNFIGPDYGYKRYNIRLNQSTEVGRFKLNTILSYVKNQGVDHSSNSGTLIVDAGRVPLLYSFTDKEGNYLTNAVSAELNPKAILEKGGYRRNNDDEIFGTFNAEMQVAKHFKVRGVFGGTVRSNQKFGRRLELDFTPGGQYGRDREVFDENFKSLFTNTQLIAEYNQTITDHNFRLLVGAANESYKEEFNKLVKTLTDPALGTPTTGTVINPTESFNSNMRTIESRLNSLFGRVGYSYADKYYAELNFRYDGSSKFAAGNRWGFFPSASAAWRLTQEAFMDNFRNNFGDLKLRASYGVLGNQNVNDYQYQGFYENYANAYGFNNVAVGGVNYFIGNPDLTWEKAATLNVGIDAAFFKQRLEVSVDYFSKRTSDILYRRSDVPRVFGATFPDYNVAEVLNEGWEVKASYVMPGKLFTHRVSVNIADNLNELVALTSGATEQIERREEFEFLRRIGQPITVYYGYKRNGYFQTADDIAKEPKFEGSTVTAGDIKFTDRNKDGVIDDNDKFILGNPFPRYTFGFTYSVAVKNFDLMVLIQGVGKRDMMVRGELVEPFHFGYGGTMYTHQTDFWTPVNPNAKYPRLAEASSPSNTNNYRTGSDIYLFNAAYARLKNVQVGYTFQNKLIKNVGMQSARVYLTGQNLLTLTDLNFFDPELTEFDNATSFNTGANSGRAYPLPVFYGFGLSVNF